MKFKLFVFLCVLGLTSVMDSEKSIAQEYGRSRPMATRRYDAQDWNRFRYYPYVYYKQNFRPQEQYRSADDLYYRYPKFMQVPTYNPYWQNYYPVPRRFHEGKHFVLDVF